MVAISSSSVSSSSLFTSTFNTHKSSSKALPTSLKFKKASISAAYATAERTSTETSFRSATPSSLYDVLGLRRGADTREVKAAYRKLARVLHPDVGSGDSSADEFMKVHSAYTTLSDPEKRADYDRTLFQRRVARSSSPMRTASGYKSRRWETDQCW